MRRLWLLVLLLPLGSCHKKADPSPGVKREEKAPTVSHPLRSSEPLVEPEQGISGFPGSESIPALTMDGDYEGWTRDGESLSYCGQGGGAIWTEEKVAGDFTCTFRVRIPGWTPDTLERAARLCHNIPPGKALKKRLTPPREKWEPLAKMQMSSHGLASTGSGMDDEGPIMAISCGDTTYFIPRCFAILIKEGSLYWRIHLAAPVVYHSTAAVPAQYCWIVGYSPAMTVVKGQPWQNNGELENLWSEGVRMGWSGEECLVSVERVGKKLSASLNGEIFFSSSFPATDPLQVGLIAYETTHWFWFPSNIEEGYPSESYFISHLQLREMKLKKKDLLGAAEILTLPEAFLGMGDYAMARETILKAMAMGIPDDLLGRAHLDLAQALSAEGRHSEAIDALRKAGSMSAGASEHLQYAIRSVCRTGTSISPDLLVELCDGAPYGCMARTEKRSTHPSGRGWAKRVVHKKTGIEFVLIPTDGFDMGSPDSEEGRTSAEGPQHRVNMSEAFYLATNEVTVDQFEKFARLGGYAGILTENLKCWGFKDGQFVRSPEFSRSKPGLKNTKVKPEGSWPVTSVSWWEANFFCHWAGLRLPTEAEWECAYRAGSQTKYPWGEEDSEAGKYGWIRENSEGHPWGVGMKLANAWGLYDMTGNVGEWCQDAHLPYDDPPTHGEAVLSPLDDREEKMPRGSSWDSESGECRSAWRSEESVGWGSPGTACVGFRPAMSVPEPPAFR